MKRFGVTLLPYLAAVLVTLAIFGLRIFVLHARMPGVLFIAPIVVAAWWGGLKPGIFATALLAGIGLFFMFLRRDGDTSFNPFPFLTLLIIGAAISWLFESLHVAQRRVKDRQWQLESEIVLRQNAEQMQRQEREHLRVTLASIGDAVITTDAQGNVTFLNRKAESLTGWNCDDAQGRPLAEVFPIFNERTGQVAENPVSKVLQSGVTVGLANHTVLRSRNGVERPIDDSAAPILDQQGAILGVVLTFRDVSQHRQAQVELRASEERFRSLSACSPVGIFLTNTQGDCTYTNPRCQAICGFTFDEAMGEGWRRFVHENSGDAVERWRYAAQSGAEFFAECCFRHCDGQVRWTEIHTAPMLSDDGTLLGYVGTVEDITDRRRIDEEIRASQERLEQADRRKDQFLATLAHELRNPLAPISNALQIWPLVQDDPVETDNLREIMDRQVQQMVRLIDDLMDISRITRGKIELRRQPVEVKTVLESAIEANRPLLDACGHRLTTVTPEEPLIVDGDVARLVQVVGNLLNNAAKYTGRNGSVELTAERDGDQAVIRVADNGPGIPRDMLSEIFESFVQVDATLGRAHGGLGIGLTLCKSLVEMHGGTIEAYSEAVGQGSELTVRLPLAQPAAIAAGDWPQATARSVLALPCHRVLVVDDVKASAETLAMMLRSLGQEVVVVHDGATALEAAAASKPDVAFLDIAMPGMDGYELARLLRQNDDHRGLVLVALTGYGQDDDRRRAFAAGFNHHLVKPTKLEALQELLATVPGRGDAEAVA